MNIEIFDRCRSDWERLIDEWIFDEKNRIILKRKLLDGLTFEELASEIDLSVQQIKIRFYKSENRLFKKVDKFKNL